MKHPYNRLTVWLAVVSVATIVALAPLPALLFGATILFALVEPVWGVYALILSVPIQELAYLPGGLSYTQGATLLALFGWGLRMLAHPERPILRGRLLPFWGVLVWALLLAASLTPYSRTEGLKETLRWGVAATTWLMIVHTVRHPWQRWGLLACLLLAPAADAMIGLGQFWTGDGPPAFRIAAELPYVRAYGTIGQPNSFAGYVNMAWPLALALSVGETMRVVQNRVKPGTRLARLVMAGMFWICALVLLAGLVASFSRGAWLGGAAGLFGMGLALGRHVARWTVIGTLVLALVLALGGAGLLPEMIAVRLSSITRNIALFDAGSVQITPANFAAVERMAHLQAGLGMFAEHPLTGVGPGNYNLAYPEYSIPPWYASRGHAHNYYIHSAAETGLIGLFAYLALLGGVAWQAIITLRRTTGTSWHSAAVGCCGIIAAVAGHNMFENLHVLSMGIQLAGVWGLLAILERPADLVVGVDTR